MARVPVFVPLWICVLGQAAGQGTVDGTILLVGAGSFVGIECVWGWEGLDLYLLLSIFDVD